ncbi:MAG: leucine-rich repeat protein [Oscillospiraceae bacterium]|nr:leucine-rich repeat protein [Oscillospiraceae bacterium]
MRLVDIKCPHCTGSVTLDAFSNTAVCDYCGKSFMLEANEADKIKSAAVPDSSVLKQNPDFRFFGKWLDSYIGTSAEVVVPNGAIKICAQAFKGNKTVTSVHLPNTLNVIEYDVFYGCQSLSTINIPASVTHIGGHAFYKCSSLQSITIPSGVKSISSHAFSNCTALNSITLSEGLEQIQAGAFLNCAISSIAIPKSVLFMDKNIFLGCKNLEHIRINDPLLIKCDLSFSAKYTERQKAQFLSQGKKCAFCGGAVKDVTYQCKQCKRIIIV